MKYFLLIWLFFIVFIGGSCDLVLSSVKRNTNHSANPCDDFYRYTCPMGMDENKTVSSRYEQLIIELQEKSNKGFASFMSTFKYLDEIDAIPLDSKTDISTMLREFIIDKCKENVKFTEYMNKNILQILESFGITDLQSESKFCSKNADTYFDKLNNDILKEDLKKKRRTASMLPDFVKFQLFIQVNRLEDGLVGIERILEDSKQIIEKWSQVTPWVKTHKMIDVVQNVSRGVSLFASPSKYHRMVKFAEILQNGFQECTNALNSTETGASIFCILLVNAKAEKYSEEPFDILTNFNAYNEKNRFINIGLPLIHYSNASKSDAALIGFVGSLLAHEYSHSMVDNSINEKNMFDYFPKSPLSCVLNQYRKLCDEYKEDDCVVNELQEEEIAADSLGMRIAHEIFKERIGDAIDDIDKETGITNQQLFFQTYFSGFCVGKPIKAINRHPGANIRVNALIQLPEFQKAFNCPASSRMMKSQTELCYFYGKNAPED